MKPVVYLSKSELESFEASNVKYCSGYLYEWEDEGVVHIHLAPLRHAFGKSSRIDFLKRSQLQEPVTTNEPMVVLLPNSEVRAFVTWEGEIVEAAVSFIPKYEELYSRSKGILEVNALKDKKVLIIGLGSFGSQISIELAKAGIERFSLFDFDRVELHNLARHTCGINDLGRLKTDAIREAILGKNPYATVDKFPINIIDAQDILEEELSSSDLIICATDNNQSRFLLSELLVKHQKPCIFGRAITRAEGGDVFIYRPGGPCYNCLIRSGALNTQDEEITNRNQLAAYVSEEEADAIVQVGLSSDIEPICNLMIKLSLVELSRGRSTGIESLSEELTYPYYMWANRRERRHRMFAPFNNAGVKPTILRWYGAKISKMDGCPICGDGLVLLDEGDDIQVTQTDLSDVNLDEV